MHLARSHVLILSSLHPCHTLDFRQDRACGLDYRRTSLIQGLPVPESQPFPPSSSLLHPSAGLLSSPRRYLSSPPPLSALSLRQGWDYECTPSRISTQLARPYDSRPPTQNSRAAIPRTPFSATSSCCQCLFHITPPRYMLTSRDPVTQMSLSLKNCPVLEMPHFYCLLGLGGRPAPQLSPQNTNTGLRLAQSIGRGRDLF
jgi:hypothetical protein